MWRYFSPMGQCCQRRARFSCHCDKKSSAQRQSYINKNTLLWVTLLASYMCIAFKWPNIKRSMYHEFHLSWVRSESPDTVKSKRLHIKQCWQSSFKKQNILAAQFEIYSAANCAPFYILQPRFRPLGNIIMMYDNISLCSLPLRKDVYISSRCLGKLRGYYFIFPVHIEFSRDHSSLLVRREYCTIYCVTNLGNLCCIFISKMEMLIRLFRFMHEYENLLRFTKVSLLTGTWQRDSSPLSRSHVQLPIL